MLSQKSEVFGRVLDQWYNFTTFSIHYRLSNTQNNEHNLFASMISVV